MLRAASVPRGARSTGCCSSTSRPGSPPTSAPERAAALSRGEGRAHRYARSARDRLAARCCSGRRRSSAASCSTPTRPTRGDRLGCDDHDRRLGGGGRRAHGRSWPRARGRAGARARFGARSRRCRRCTPRSSATVARCTSTRAPGSRSTARRGRSGSTSSASTRSRATRLSVTVRCSKGTYVRVLAEDIGRSLGCGAHLAQLRRLAIGPFSARRAR